ncbi:hypothetical protein B0H12DRAFT_1168801 [Mycena haematopus]|nr:hypothetical protein B0H12DRAFT_1168801 [Mycena haematopus]
MPSYAGILSSSAVSTFSLHYAVTLPGSRASRCEPSPDIGRHAPSRWPFFRSRSRFHKLRPRAFHVNFMLFCLCMQSTVGLISRGRPCSPYVSSFPYFKFPFLLSLIFSSCLLVRLHFSPESHQSRPRETVMRHIVMYQRRGRALR